MMIHITTTTITTIANRRFILESVKGKLTNSETLLSNIDRWGIPIDVGRGVNDGIVGNGTRRQSLIPHFFPQFGRLQYLSGRARLGITRQCRIVMNRLGSRRRRRRGRRIAMGHFPQHGPGQ